MAKNGTNTYNAHGNAVSLKFYVAVRSECPHVKRKETLFALLTSRPIVTFNLKHYRSEARITEVKKVILGSFYFSYENREALLLLRGQNIPSWSLIVVSCQFKCCQYVLTFTGHVALHGPFWEYSASALSASAAYGGTKNSVG